MSDRKRKLIDRRWDGIAKAWLEDAGLPDDLVTRYVVGLAEQLADIAEQYVAYDIPEAEQDREQAAYDAHINRQIDEARGK